jgi:UDP-N-acetylmuramate dehydrogenase
LQAIVEAGASLGSLTALRLGGQAQYLARPRGVDDLREVLRWARGDGLAVRFLASGFNVLVRSAVVPGVVVHLESPAFSDVRFDGNTVEAGAAVPLTALISQTARAGLAGLENLTGIPGTVGGAVRGNAGDRQATIRQYLRETTVLDRNLQEQTLSADDYDLGTGFGGDDEAVILSARLALEPQAPETIVKRMRRTWIIKKENQPYSHQACAYIFASPSPELSAAMLIERAGFKGARQGSAEVSDRDPNFIVANPGATADDVLGLIERLQEGVENHFGILLELCLNVW